MQPITLAPKPGGNYERETEERKRHNFGTIFMMNADAKIFNKILANQTPKNLKVSPTQNKWNLLHKWRRQSSAHRIPQM